MCDMHCDKQLLQLLHLLHLSRSSVCDKQRAEIKQTKQTLAARVTYTC